MWGQKKNNVKKKARNREGSDAFNMDGILGIAFNADKNTSKVTRKQKICTTNKASLNRKDTTHEKKTEAKWPKM